MAVSISPLPSSLHFCQWLVYNILIKFHNWIWENVSKLFLNYFLLVLIYVVSHESMFIGKAEFHIQWNAVGVWESIISAKKTIISIHKCFQNLLPYKCLMWSLPVIFRLIFALLTVYYQYHIPIFSSHIKILVMNWYLFSPNYGHFLDLQCEGGQMTEVHFLSLQLFDGFNLFYPLAK